MPKIGDLVMNLVIDGKNATVTIEEFGRKINDVDGKGRRATDGLSGGFLRAKMAILGAIAATSGIAIALNNAIQQASKFQEANSKMLTVFKDMQGQARSSRDVLVSSYNMSTTAATELLAATGDILTGFGMSQKVALGMSLQTQKLAADLASFTNAQGGAKAVSEALTKAMLGERESIKTYGIAILEADVQQRLYSKGQDKLAGAALRQAKAQATLEIAMEQSKNAIGDLDRTQHSFANTQRRLHNSIEDLSLKFGAVFIPMATKVLQWFSDLVNKIPIDKVVGTLGALFAVFQDFATRIWNIFKSVGNAIAYLLTGDFEQVGNEMEKLWSAIAEGWDQTAQNIKQSHVDTQVEFKAFMEGAVEAHSTAQQEMQAKEEESKKAREERLKAETKAREDFYQREKEMRESYKEMKAGWAEEDLEAEDAKLDYMYETNRLSYEAYAQVLNDRLNYAKAVYGQESMEYMKAVDAKKKIDSDYQKNRSLQQVQEVQNFANSMMSMLSLAQGGSRQLFEMWKAFAIANALINAYAGAAKSLATYGWPLGAPMAAAALFQGMMQVASIRAQKYRATAYATGGEIDRPTLSLMGEKGIEIVSPKKDFIQVVNTMVQKGEIKAGQNQDSSHLLSQRLQALETAIRETRVTHIDIDGIEIARATERGQIKVNTGQVGY